MNKRMYAAAAVFAAFGLALAIGESVVAQESDMVAGPGKDVVEKTCTVCHPSSQFTSQAKDQIGWEETVDRMAGMGAAVTDEERPTIVKYLVTNYGLKR